MAVNKQVLIKNVRLSFPRLFEAEPSVPGGTPKFSAAFLIDPNSDTGKRNLSQIVSAIKEVCDEEWGKEEMYKTMKEGRVALTRGDDHVHQQTGEPYDGYPGMMVVKASSPQKRRPATVDRRRRPVTDEDQVFYGGCYVNAAITIYTVKGQEKGGNGVFASLEAVQFYADGEPFGAGPVDPESVFDDEGDDGDAGFDVDDFDLDGNDPF